MTTTYQALADLALTASEKTEMQQFGIHGFADEEMRDILAAEIENERKDRMRAAVKEIIELTKQTDVVLREEFDKIRLANTLIAEARLKAKKIALARAYGSETRNYMPLLALVSFTRYRQVRNEEVATIPQEWLDANTDRVLEAFREQGKTAAKKSAIQATGAKTPAAKTAIVSSAISKLNKK